MPRSLPHLVRESHGPLGLRVGILEQPLQLVRPCGFIGRLCARCASAAVFADKSLRARSSSVELHSFSAVALRAVPAIASSSSWHSVVTEKSADGHKERKSQMRTSSLATELFSRARSSSAAVADSGAAEGALRASSSFLWSVCFSTSLAAICCAEHASVSKRAKGKCSSSNARLLERFDVSVHVAC